MVEKTYEREFLPKGTVNGNSPGQERESVTISGWLENRLQQDSQEFRFNSEDPDVKLRVTFCFLEALGICRRILMERNEVSQANRFFAFS